MQAGPARAVEATGGASFSARPDDSVVQDFLAHVAKEGSPHTWWAHSRTRPPSGAKPVLLTRFRLPEALDKSPDRWALCPICQPDTPKYTWGYLSWYPEEEGGDGLLRAIGHDCGSRFFGKERYKEALSVFHREQDEQADRTFIRRSHPLIAAAIAEAQALRLWASAADQFRIELLGALTNVNAKDIVRRSGQGGALHVSKMRAVSVVKRDGTSTTRLEPISEHVATVIGADFLSDKAKGLGATLETAMTALRTATNRLNAQAEHVDSGLSADDVHVMAKSIRAGFTSLSNVRVLLDATLLFASTENLRQVQRWSCHPDSDAPFKLILRDDQKTLSLILPRKRGAPQLGMRDAVLVQVPDALRTPLPPASPRP